jgi:hypothetical protein
MMPPARKHAPHGRRVASDRLPRAGRSSRSVTAYRSHVKRAVRLADAELTSALVHLTNHPLVRSTRDFVERVLHSITKEKRYRE